MLEIDLATNDIVRTLAVPATAIRPRTLESRVMSSSHEKKMRATIANRRQIRQPNHPHRCVLFAGETGRPTIEHPAEHPATGWKP